MGMFGPLASQARGEDCFSVWFIWGVSSIEYSAFFDKTFNNKSVYDWSKIIVKLVLYIWETYDVLNICVPELQENKENPWH